MKVVAAVVSFLSIVGCLSAGCTADAAKGMAELTQSSQGFLMAIEDAGLDHDSELYLPAELRAELSGAGFTIGCPGGYFRSRIGSGRGLASRATDAIVGPPAPASTPVPTPNEG